MESKLKVWTGLGLATALAGAGLAGCSDNTEEPDAAVSGETGEGEGGGGEAGEGGEGEGGVDVASASSDPVEYGSALAVAEAHAIAARDAFAIGRTKEAAGMFGHPTAEVLAEMDPVFAERGVTDFKSLFTAASQTIRDGGSAAQVNERYDAIMGALNAAGAKAPADGTSAAMVSAGITADQIERAIAMYQQATQSDAYELYLDGYGFYKAAASAFEREESAIRSQDADLHQSITAALSLLADAYPSAERPETLDSNEGHLLAAG